MDRRSFFAGVLAVAVVKADRVMDDRKEFLRRSPSGCDEAHHQRIEAAHKPGSVFASRCVACGALYMAGRWYFWETHRFGRRLDLTKARASVIV